MLESGPTSTLLVSSVILLLCQVLQSATLTTTTTKTKQIFVAVHFCRAQRHRDDDSRATTRPQARPVRLAISASQR